MLLTKEKGKKSEENEEKSSLSCLRSGKGKKIFFTPDNAAAVPRPQSRSSLSSLPHVFFYSSGFRPSTRGSGLRLFFSRDR